MAQGFSLRQGPLPGYAYICVGLDVIGTAHRVGEQVFYKLKWILPERGEHLLVGHIAEVYKCPREAITRIGMSQKENIRRREKWDKFGHLKTSPKRSIHRTR